MREYTICDLRLSVTDKKINELKQEFYEDNQEYPDENELDNLIYDYITDEVIGCLDYFDQEDIVTCYTMVDTL